MRTIKIGSEEHDWSEVDADWIAQRISRRRLNGEIVCVQVRIDEPPEILY